MHKTNADHIQKCFAIYLFFFLRFSFSVGVGFPILAQLSYIRLHINEALFSQLTFFSSFFFFFCLRRFCIKMLQHVRVCGLVNTRILMFAILTSAFVYQRTMYLLSRVIELRAAARDRDLYTIFFFSPRLFSICRAFQRRRRGRYIQQRFV